MLTRMHPNPTHAQGAPINASAARRRVPRRRLVALVLTCAFAGFASGVLIIASTSVAAGTMLIAAGVAIQRHALVAPALSPPGAGLNLEPLGAQGVLPDSMPPGVASPSTTDRSDALGPGVEARWLPIVAASQDPLAGPRVSVAIRTTLVQRDIDGKLVAPFPNPAEAALGLISLDVGSRRAINAALNIRGRHLDHAVIINLPFIVLAQSAQAGANKPVVVGAAAIALARSREFLAVDDLESLIAAQLPAQQRSQYRALLQDYWHEHALDSAQDRARKGQDPAPESLLIAEAKLKLAGEEAARSFERTLRSGDLLHYWFSRHLGLKPDQAEPFRATLAAYAQEYGGDGDKAAKLMLVEDLRAGLTVTQQRTLERNMKGFLD